MCRIEGVEAILGYCAFDVSASSVIEEDNDRRQNCTECSIVHHQGESKDNLNERLRGEIYFVNPTISDKK